MLGGFQTLTTLATNGFKNITDTLVDVASVGYLLTKDMEQRGQLVGDVTHDQLVVWGASGGTLVDVATAWTGDASATKQLDIGFNKSFACEITHNHSAGHGTKPIFNAGTVSATVPYMKIFITTDLPVATVLALGQ